MGLVQINDPYNLLFTGSKKTVDEKRNDNINRIYGDGEEETPAETLDASAITNYQLIERMIEEAPYIHTNYPELLNTLISPIQDECVTYGDVFYSASKLEVKFYSEIPTTEHPGGLITTLHFNGGIN